MNPNIKKRLYVVLALIPYLVGSWIIYDKLGKMIAVAVSLVVIGAFFAIKIDLMPKNKQDSKKSEQEKR